MNQIKFNSGNLFNNSSILDISSSFLLFDIGKGKKIEFDTGKMRESKQ